MYQFQYLTFSIINILPVLMHSIFFLRNNFSGSPKQKITPKILIIVFRGRIHLIRTWKMKSRCPCPNCNFLISWFISLTQQEIKQAPSSPLAIPPKVLILWAEFASVSLSVNCLPQSTCVEGEVSFPHYSGGPKILALFGYLIRFFSEILWDNAFSF